MKKITATLLLVLAFAACSEQRPATMKDMLKTTYKTRSTVKAIKAEITKAKGFSENTAKPETKTIKAEMEENGKDFKFVIIDNELEAAFNGEKFTIVNHKDKWFKVMTNPQEYNMEIQRNSEEIKNFLPFATFEDFSSTVDSSDKFDDYVWGIDTTINNEEVYHISNKSHDDELDLDFYTDQFISKKTGFPLEEWSTIKNGDHLVQKKNLYVNKIESVPDIDDANFVINIPQDYITVEEFFAKDDKKQQQEVKSTELNIGDVVPNFTLKDADGKEVSLESLRGKPVVLDFWGTWCIWCVVAMPKMEAVYQDMKENAYIYGISCREKESADPKAFLKEKGVSYPTLVDGDEVAKLLNIEGYPSLLVIDKEGKLLHKHAGYDKELDKTLIKLIKENQ